MCESEVPKEHISGGISGSDRYLELRLMRDFGAGDTDFSSHRDSDSKFCRKQITSLPASGVY